MVVTLNLQKKQHCFPGSYRLHDTCKKRPWHTDSVFLFHIFYSTRLAYLRKCRCKRNRKCKKYYLQLLLYTHHSITFLRKCLEGTTKSVWREDFIIVLRKKKNHSFGKLTLKLSSIEQRTDYCNFMIDN